MLEHGDLTTRLRKEAIEGAMATSSPDVIAEICEDYPQELVWAVHDQRRIDFLPIIMEMVDDYRDDPYLLHRIVGCVARIGTMSELEYTLHVAATALSTEAEPTAVVSLRDELLAVHEQRVVE